MFSLKEYRSKANGLADLLGYALLADEGIVVQKDGSFLAGFEFVGIDTASSTFDELAVLSEQVSNSIKMLGREFMIHVDAIRSRKKAYPHESKCFFPDKISKMIDDERREFFAPTTDKGLCYSTNTYIIITYNPIDDITTKGNFSLEKELEKFKNVLLEIEDSLSSVLYLTRLSEYEINYGKDEKILHSDLLAHLQQCISGELFPFAVPKTPMYLDALLGSEDLLGGIAPKLGNKFIKTISIDGLPQESYPAMMSYLSSLGCELRFSTRYICLSQYDAELEIEKYIKGWNQNVYSFIDQYMENENAKPNRNSLAMRENAEEAKAEVQSGFMGAGYMSTTVVMMNENEEELNENIREVRRILQTLGFGCRLETINALEAFLGSLPGNGYANLRRPMVTTLNLADFLPLSTVYTGSPFCPSPFFPANSRPLAVVTTENATTPFWLNLHVGDLGHTLIFGPTGSGKSTLLGLIVSQFRCYKDAKIFAFDKGMSLFPLCKAVGGSHYEIGVDNLAFEPLRNIDESFSEMAFCEEWIETLMELQGVTVTPKHRMEIHEAMLKLLGSPKDQRTLTNFSQVVSDREVIEALTHYTVSGSMGILLDAEEDTLDLADFVTFEMDEIMNKGDKNLIPVLLYIFHRIEKALTGQPALVLIDEGWQMLSHPVFNKKIKEWLKVFRKKNCAIVLATQSLSDAKNSGILDVLVESCPTKILLANPNARQEDQYELYKGIGLNDREISIIAREATPKRDYYITNPVGKRLIQLALGKKTLSFIGVSDKESINEIKDLIELDEENWQEAWLKQRGAA